MNLEIIKSLNVTLFRNILSFLEFINFILVTIFLTIFYFVKMMFPLKRKEIKGQLALVTGGGNGLGQSISMALAEKGCDVIILDVDIVGAENTATTIRKTHNVKAFAFKVDVSNYNEVQDVRKTIEKEIGEVSILVNNAGLLPQISLLEGTPNEIERIFKVNLMSNFWVIREFIGSMHKTNSGHIVAISSLSAYDALGRQLIYSSSKYAIRGLMEGLQEELRLDKSNIVATTVYPGFINTNNVVVDYMFRAMKNPRSLVFLSPKEVADAVIDAIICDKLNCTVPSCYVLLLNLFRLFPKEVQNRFRDKYKPMLYRNINLK